MNKFSLKKQSQAHHYSFYPGQKFGRLTIIKISTKQNNDRLWQCRCECGVLVFARACRLVSGETFQCGQCQRKSI